MLNRTKSNPDKQIDIAMQEYLRLSNGILAIENANEKLLGFGFTLISLSAVAGLFQKVIEIFFVLPIAVIGILTYSSVSYACIYSMAAYKKRVEDLINTSIGRRLLIWEDLAKDREDRSVSSRLLLFIYFIVGASICVLSVTQVGAKYGLHVGWSLGLISAALLALFLLGIRQMNRTFERTYKLAKELSIKQV